MQNSFITFGKRYRHLENFQGFNKGLLKSWNELVIIWIRCIVHADGIVVRVWNRKLWVSEQSNYFWSIGHTKSIFFVLNSFKKLIVIFGIDCLLTFKSALFCCVVYVVLLVLKFKKNFKFKLWKNNDVKEIYIPMSIRLI